MQHPDDLRFIIFEKCWVMTLLTPSQLIYWNVFAIILNMCLVIYLPYKYFFFFSLPAVTKTEITVASIIICIQVLEIGIKLHTTSDMMGKEKQNSALVTKQYLARGLPLDMLSIIAVISLIISESTFTPIIRLLIYFKLPSIFVYDRLITISIKSSIFEFLYTLIKVGFLYLAYCNFTAGAFFKIDYHYYTQKGYYFQNNMVWLVNADSLHDIINWSQPVHYVYSIFWSIITASCTGYGDLTPLNPPQVLLTLLVFAPNVLLFGFLIDNINYKFSQLREKKLLVRQSEMTVLRLLRDANVSKQTFNQFKFFHKKIIDKQTSEQTFVMDELSPNLKMELTKQLFHRPLKKFNNLSLQDTMTISECIHERSCFYDQMINPENYFYFVIEGEGGIILKGLDICSHEDGQSIIGRYYTNSSLNMYNFFIRQTNPHISYVCSNFTRFYIIEDLPNILSLRNKYFEITLLKQYSAYGIQCLLCESSKHVTQQCPYFTINSSENPIQSKIKKRYCQSIQNKRETYVRSQRCNQLVRNWSGFQKFNFQQQCNQKHI